MIVPASRATSALLFTLKGSVLPHVAPRILAVMAAASVLLLVDRHLLPLQHANASAFAVFGVALSLFLGFRNNAAYDRWWEGRKLWGQLVADLRALARESHAFGLPEPRRGRVLRLALSFLHLHRLNLRRLSPDAAADAWTEEAHARATHPPCAALDRLAGELAEARAAGEIDGFGARVLTERLGRITLAQAGCERIAATPLPFVYSLLVYRTSVLYCLLVPLGLMESAGWLTPFFVGVIAYVFFGLAEVTHELEDPFGETVNGLPLDAMCRTVEISLAPHMGLPAPPPLKPVDTYLG